MLHMSAFRIIWRLYYSTAVCQLAWHWAVSLSLAEGSVDRREPVPEAAIPSWVFRSARSECTGGWQSFL